MRPSVGALEIAHTSKDLRANVADSCEFGVSFRNIPRKFTEPEVVSTLGQYGCKGLDCLERERVFLHELSKPMAQGIIA